VIFGSIRLAVEEDNKMLSKHRNQRVYIALNNIRKHQIIDDRANFKPHLLLGDPTRGEFDYHTLPLILCGISINLLALLKIFAYNIFRRIEELMPCQI
jgi:hypothetical protein